MKRIDAIELVGKSIGDALLVSNIGFPSRELYAVADRPQNFYMLGSMGLCSSIALGIALATPGRRVVGLDGDGSVLMNLGTLATHAHYAPDTYLLVILDNGAYGSTGSQPTFASRKTDLAAMAVGAGVSPVRTVTTLDELKTALTGRGILIVKVQPGNAEVPIIPLAPGQIVERFSAALGRPAC